MDEIDYYRELVNDIQIRTNLNFEYMNDVDRAVIKEIFVRMRQKYLALVKEVDEELVKIEDWENHYGRLDDIDVWSLIKNELN